MPNDATIKPWGVRILIFHSLIFRQNCKNDHGALVGLTTVKGTSVETFFSFVEKGWKKWFVALVGLTEKKGRSVRKQVTKKD